MEVLVIFLRQVGVGVIVSVVHTFSKGSPQLCIMTLLYGIDEYTHQDYINISVHCADHNRLCIFCTVSATHILLSTSS